MSWHDKHTERERLARLAEIEDWVHEGRQAQRVWSNDAITAQSSMVAFLAWAVPLDERVRP